MPVPGDTPLQRALVRGLVFNGILEALFYRLLPVPPDGSAGAAASVHASLSRAGGVTFVLSFLLVLMGLAAVGAGALRRRLWPAGYNSALAAALLSLAALAVVAAMGGHGPVLAIVFTALTLLALMLIGMLGFSGADSPAGRTFAVLYTSSVLCSGFAAIAGFAEQIPMGAAARRTARAAADLSEPAVMAGTGLLLLAACAAFLAHTGRRAEAGGGSIRWRPAALAALPAVCLAAGALLAPPELSPLGPEVGPLRVGLLSCALFLGVTTAVSTLVDARRRTVGYGLLLLVLAGYPLRIAYQDLLVVLGAALALAPPPPSVSRYSLTASIF